MRKRDTFGPILPQVIQHESGRYYTYETGGPHMTLEHAVRWTNPSIAQDVVNMLNTSAGRGRYCVVEVQS